MANIPFNTQVYMLNGHPTDTLNARDLHHYLTTQINFTDWFIDCIERYHLKEDQDYIVMLYKKQHEKDDHNAETDKPHHTEDHYYISFDVAKIISALDSSLAGQQLRYQLHDWEHSDHSKSLENQRVTLPIMDMMNLLRFIRFYQGLAIELPQNSIQISDILERIQYESK